MDASNVTQVQKESKMKTLTSANFIEMATFSENDLKANIKNPAWKGMKPALQAQYPEMEERGIDAVIAFVFTGFIKNA